jgi:transposase
MEQPHFPFKVDETPTLKKRKHHTITFIPYEMDRQWLLPPSLGELIPSGHMVRIVDAAIDRIDDALFLASYVGGGRSNYHPKLMVFGYMQRLYSSRLITKAVREQVPFMWLAAGQTPDFRTLNRFRSERAKDLLEPVFTAVLEMLVEEGYVKLEHYFVDGTKIESAANRYTFVWEKAVVKHKAKLQEKVQTLFTAIDEAEKQEDHEHGGKDLREFGEAAGITSEKLEDAVKRLEEKLQEQPKDKPLKKAIRQLRKDWLPRLQKYEAHQHILGTRNSYSKTDPDATFMRMKEDHMRNGQLKPGYNVQVGTENQFILGYSLHQRPTDTRCLKPHLEKVEAALGKLPGTLIADAGYGGEENYAYLEEKQVEALVKYSTYHKEKSKAWQADISKIDNWVYDETEDTWMCAAGKQLAFRYESKEKTGTGK